MDEGKHMHWGNSHPDLLQFKELDYTYPPDQYRPLRRAQKPRPSAYPIHELTSARLTLMRSLVIPNNRKQSVKPARLKSLLGLPSKIPEVVLEHVESGKSYQELEPRRPNRAGSSMDINAARGLTGDSRYERTPSPGADNARVVGECSQGLDEYTPLGEERCHDDFDSARSIHISGKESYEPSPLESRLTELGLVPVLKCDYCEFSYSVSKNSDVINDLELQSDMKKHLLEEIHYCASSYYAREDQDVLTELNQPALVKNPEAYLETVLATCPECSLVFETIHQCAVHYRYTHDQKLGKYALSQVLERCQIDDLFSRQCSVCQRVFDNDKSLNFHIKSKEHWPFVFRNYNGDKRFYLIQCPLETCPSIFRNLFGFKAHFKTAHDDVTVAPPVVVRTFQGERTNRTSVLDTFLIPVPEKGQRVQAKDEEMIVQQDKKLLRQVIRFFGNVKGYPAKPVEATFLRYFKDKHVERLSEARKDLERLYKAKYRAIHLKDVQTAELSDERKHRSDVKAAKLKRKLKAQKRARQNSRAKNKNSD